SKNAATSTSSWSGALSTMNGVLGAFGVQLSVGAVVSFAQSILDAGDHIQKMADQTSLSTDEVQRLMFISSQTGTSVETMVGAIQNLQQRLPGGVHGAVGAGR